MEGCWTHHPETDEPVFREEKVGSEKGLAQSHKAINLEEWGTELRTVGSKFYAFFWTKLCCTICDWTLCFSESCYNKFQTSCVHKKASPTYLSLWNLIFLTLAKPPMVETAGSPWTPPLLHPPKSSQVGNRVLLFQPLLSPASGSHTYYLCLSSASPHLPRNHLHACGPQPTRLLCSWNFPGKNSRAGCHLLLQGVFPTQGSNPCLCVSWIAGRFSNTEPSERPLEITYCF